MNLSNTLKRTANNMIFSVKKHSPTILVVGGVIGMAGAAVMACFATTKVDTIAKEAKEKLNKIEDMANDARYAGKYTEEDKKKDMLIVYSKTGLKLAKTYLPAVAVGTISAVSIFAGYRIMKGRNLALAAAYSAVDKGFKEYRERVVEQFGKDVDRNLRYNIIEKEIETTTIDKDGKEVTKKEKVKVAGEPSIYARFFDDTALGWKSDHDYNIWFLNQTEQWANNRLRTHGRVILNEVYDALGIKLSRAGQTVGWVYDPKHPEKRISFGIYDIHSESNRAFVNGVEPNILLDFNVDGDILNSLPDYKFEME